MMILWLVYLHNENSYSEKKPSGIEANAKSHDTIMFIREGLTHYGLVTLYGDTELGQHWLR